jgi:hypothetical protein
VRPDGSLAALPRRRLPCGQADVPGIAPGGVGTSRFAHSLAVCAPIEDALNPEMAHLTIAIHVESPEKAKQHGVPVV